MKDLVLIKGFGNRRYEPPSSLMPHEPVGMQGPSNRRVRVSEEDAGGAGCARLPDKHRAEHAVCRCSRG